MIAILTGDLINSRKLASPELWIDRLKNALAEDSSAWEIFRGDSFQKESIPEEALLRAVYIKACVKTIKSLDVRIAIGIGEKGYSSSRLSESNGEAFIRSGEKFEDLKKERVQLAIRSPWDDFDYEMNIILRIALIAMANWTQASCEVIKLAIENPAVSQQELADLSKKSQSSVSEALKRAHFSDILELDALYRKKISTFIKA